MLLIIVMQLTAIPTMRSFAGHAKRHGLWMSTLNAGQPDRTADKPTMFWWESPSGKRLLTFRAEHYMTGWPSNILLINSEPSADGKYCTVHLRETNGKDAVLNLKNGLNGNGLSLLEVDVTGKPIANQSHTTGPLESKFFRIIATAPDTIKPLGNYPAFRAYFTTGEDKKE